MTLSRPHQVTLALALALPTACAFAAPVETSLSLTGLNYTLTSLDPTSATAPGLSTQTSSVFSLFVKPFKGNTSTDSVSTGMLPGDYFDSSVGSIALPSGQGSANKQGNGRSVNVALSATDLLNPSSSAYSGDYAYAQVKTYADYVLSAHTRLVITGDLLVTNQIDSAAISALTAGSTDALTVLLETGFSPYLVSSVDAPVTTNASVISPYGDYWYEKSSVSQTFQGGLASAVDTSPHGVKIELVITNDNDVEAGFSLNSIAYARASAFTSAVPEPGTWALMSLGLIGIAAVARRRSA